ncbi:proton-conducting transporter membrane subunit [Yoonia sp. GPGPB17]|uniref:proton-conducting transporter transmembrane domain-containing protein n=1 Tax=Yoonia sp. GPGPB17 TaxID=3026147 RepID=UPI0030C273DC
MDTSTPTRWMTPAGLIPVAIAGSLFIWFAQMIPVIGGGDTLRYVWEWVPSLGVNVSIYIDGLSLTFALLITGIGALVMLYSARYLAGHVHQARFSLYLTSFMLAMIGLVVSDNLLALFVFWELTTITSYLLIGFSHDTAKARRSALQALLMTGVGGLALLAGIILIGTTAGTFEMSEINAMDGALKDSVMYLPIVLLVLAGAFTKSAQIPFHFWLPNAMAAPTPVSAYLHSATMVKAGVYLMARTHPSLAGTDFWLWTLTIFGAITMVFASVMALRQTDLKLALAYTTLMALGALTLLLGNESGYTITAAATFLIVHSLYKAALFLVVGILDAQTGTRDANSLFGLARATHHRSRRRDCGLFDGRISTLPWLYRQRTQICWCHRSGVRANLCGRCRLDFQRLDGRDCRDRVFPPILEQVRRTHPTCQRSPMADARWSRCAGRVRRVLWDFSRDLGDDIGQSNRRRNHRQCGTRERAEVMGWGEPAAVPEYRNLCAGLYDLLLQAKIARDPDRYDHTRPQL